MPDIMPDVEPFDFSNMPPPDAEVMLELTVLSWDGSVKRYRSGCRPQYVIRSDYQTSALHRFIGAETVATGETVKAEVWFVSPEAYPHTLWEGRTVDVAEGARVVGNATVLKALNPLLLWPASGGEPGP